MIGATKKGAPSLRKVNGGKYDDGSRNDKDDMVKIHLTFDHATFRLIETLKVDLRATSLAEVLRRALHAYEAYDPIFSSPAAASQVESGGNVVRVDGATRDYYVTLPRWSKDRLDTEKSERGFSNAETMSRALSVLVQLMANRKLAIASSVGENGAAKEPAGGDALCAEKVGDSLLFIT